MSVNNTQRALLANYLLGQGSSSTQGKNYVKNSIAINGTDNVTASGVGSSVAKNTTTPLTGISDFSIALGNNTTGYIEWSLDSLDRSLTNQNCQLTFDYKITSIGSVVQGQVYIGGNLSVAQTIPATPTTSTFSMNVPCGDLSGATTVRISNATGNSGASVLNIANVNYGKATNIGTVAQAVIYGSALYPTTANCNWQSTSTVFATFAPDADCPTPTVTGNALAPATKIPGITFASLPPGDYEITVRGSLRDATLDTNSCTFAISDGTNRFGQTNIYQGANVGGLMANLTTRVRYTAPQSNVTFQVVLKSDNAANTCQLAINDTANEQSLEFIVKQFPLSSQQAVSSAQADFDWTSFTPTGSWSSNTTYSGKYRRVGDTMEVQTLVALSGAPTSANLTVNIPSGFTIDTSKLLNAGTEDPVLGQAQIFDSGVQNYQARVHYNNTTSVLLRVMGASGTYVNSTTVTQAVPFTFGVADYISFSYKIPISGWSGNQRAPTLVGSVTSNSNGAERIERAIITNSGTCTISSQSGSWLTSATINGTGRCDLVWPSSNWSSAPTCFIQGKQANTCASTNNAFPTTTGVSILTQTCNGASPLNLDFSIECIGPR